MATQTREWLHDLEYELGDCPGGRRIVKLWSKRGGTDCITEVGRPDPLRGGTVLAIFDMGPSRPFVLWWRPQGGGPRIVREFLAPDAYSLEFED